MNKRYMRQEPYPEPDEDRAPVWLGLGLILISFIAGAFFGWFIRG